MKLTNKQVIWAYQHRRFLQACLTRAKDTLRRAQTRVRHLESKLGVAFEVSEIFEGVALDTRHPGYMTCVAYVPRIARVWKNLGTSNHWGVDLEYDQGFGSRKQAYSSCMYGTKEQAMFAAKRFLTANEIPQDRMSIREAINVVAR